MVFDLCVGVMGLGESGVLGVTDEGAAEVETDDGGEEVGIEGGDDEAVHVDPVDFGGIGGEEEEAFGEFGVADVDGDVGEEDGDDFGEGDDEEDAGEGDETAGPLEAFVVVVAGFFDEGALGFEGLDVDEVLLSAGVEGGAPDSHEAAEEGGGEEGDEF